MHRFNILIIGTSGDGTPFTENFEIEAEDKDEAEKKFGEEITKSGSQTLLVTLSKYINGPEAGIWCISSITQLDEYCAHYSVKDDWHICSLMKHPFDSKCDEPWSVACSIPEGFNDIRCPCFKKT
jgi:hypothetical protein